MNHAIAESAPEDCVRVKNLGYSSSHHIRIYGERFEIVSDPFPAGDGSCRPGHNCHGTDEANAAAPDIDPCTSERIVSKSGLMYRKNKNPFHKEKLTDGHRLGLMGMV